jgi:hypothetical protein
LEQIRTIGGSPFSTLTFRRIHVKSATPPSPVDAAEVTIKLKLRGESVLDFQKFFDRILQSKTPQLSKFTPEVEDWLREQDYNLDD